MEIQRADKRHRAIVAAVFVGAIALGALSLVGFQSWLEGTRQLAPAQAKDALSAAFIWISASACLVTLLMGLYLWRLGARIRARGRFPLPGARVIRDTAVLEGAAARRRGAVLQAMGAAFAVCALGLFAASWFLYSTLLTGAF